MAGLYYRCFEMPFRWMIAGAAAETGPVYERT